MEEREERNN